MPTPEAGRELDERMAALLGWIVEPKDDRYWRTPDGDYFNRIAIGGGIRAWSPSTEIAAAWQVVESLRPRGDFVLSWEERIGAWLAEFWPKDDKEVPLGGANAETAPLAICRAALAALGQS